MNELVGRRLGQYEIKEKIGQGGMALVFKAYQPALDRFVAVKVLSPTLAEITGFTERFQLEARAIARLSHPNILPVYDSGIQDSYNYLVMRYVPDSTTLNGLIQRHTPLNRMLDYVIQVAEALHYTHEQGIIHRDVKPSNILIDGKWALLSDFGLVKEMSDHRHLTGSSNGIGTAAYMSPEQARGVKLDQRADIYSVGVILYEILTGTIPHDASTPVSILLKRTTEAVPPPHLLNPDVPHSLENVVMHALSLDPEQRYSSAALLAEALRQVQRDISSSLGSRETFVLGQSPVTRPAENAPTARSTERRGKNYLTWMVGGVAAAGLILILLFLFGFLTWGRAEAQPGSQAETGAQAGPPLAAAPATSTPTATLIPLETPQALIRSETEIRSGPGENYDLLGYLPAGARAEIISRNPEGDWWQIKTGLGLAGGGWIKGEAEAIQTRYTESVPIALAPPTPTEIPTQTPVPTATAMPPATPSATPAPTETPLPAATPLPSPSPTFPAPPSPTAVVGGPVASPPPTPVEGEFVLLRPVSLERPSYGVTEFEWRWTGPLPEDQGFEVRVWKDGEAPAGVHDAVLDRQSGRVQARSEGIYRLTTDISNTPGVRNRRGEYNWTVILVQVSPEYKDLGIQASPGRFRFEPITGGGGGSDSDGDDSGGGAFN